MIFLDKNQKNNKKTFKFWKIFTPDRHKSYRKLYFNKIETELGVVNHEFARQNVFTHDSSLKTIRNNNLRKKT